MRRPSGVLPYYTLSSNFFVRFIQIVYKSTSRPRQIRADSLNPRKTSYNTTIKSFNFLEATSNVLELEASDVFLEATFNVLELEASDASLF